MKKGLKKKQKDNRPFGDIFNEYCCSYVSDDFTDKETIQQYLNVAAIAWNLSLLKGEKRKIGIDKFISDYVINNPKAPEWDVQALRNDVVNLINFKETHYADVHKTLINVEVKVINGERRVSVASIKNE